MNDVLEWVEKAALENMRGHAQAAETLSKEATQTLTVLLAMLSGALAYAVKSVSLWMPVMLVFYLFALCVILVTKCMMIGEFPAITNEPNNLMQDGYELDVLRKVELRNIQQRIDQAGKRNTVTAKWLNRVRVGIICGAVGYVMAIVAMSLMHRGAQVVAVG
jgi:hypothetical protein